MYGVNLMCVCGERKRESGRERVKKEGEGNIDERSEQEGRGKGTETAVMYA